MRVLVGCECSGVVRDAFIKAGHEAISCDLQPTDAPGPHYHGDLFDLIDYPWDIAIFHPPCTHTAVSGARHFQEKWGDGRQATGVAFFFAILKRAAHIPCVCVEQPVSIMSRLYRKPDQIIQPYQFGHPETKATCLWLKGLEPLRHTKVMKPDYAKKADGSYYVGKDGKRFSRIHFMGGKNGNSKVRSVTYTGVAKAMANQWGGSKHG